MKPDYVPAFRLSQFETKSDTDEGFNIRNGKRVFMYIIQIRNRNNGQPVYSKVFTDRLVFEKTASKMRNIADQTSYYIVEITIIG